MLTVALALWHRAAREPWLLWTLTASLATIVMLVTVGLSWFGNRKAAPKKRRATATPAVARARTLAERGMAAGDIARQTGISQDAVATIMRASRSMAAITESPVRQSRPSPARSAAPRAD